MGGRIDSPGPAADNGQSDLGQVPGEHFSGTQSIPVGFPRSHNGDALVRRGHAAFQIQGHRRVGDFFQEAGIPRVLEGNHLNVQLPALYFQPGRQLPVPPFQEFFQHSRRENAGCAQCFFRSPVKFADASKTFPQAP